MENSVEKYGLSVEKPVESVWKAVENITLPGGKVGLGIIKGATGILHLTSSSPPA